jgi:hypothetical protein
MASVDYGAICKENLEKYGTEVKNYGKVLLSDAYKERTHFLYELFQNAEDACERMRRKYKDVPRFYVKIDLYLDRLEFRHNGDPFNEEDIRSICGIVNTTKTKEYEMIGKFGIGFKSVYAYTNSPEIHSGGNSFKILNYVSPSQVTPKENIDEKETLIIINFDKSEPDMKTSFEEVKEKLERLDFYTLLFLERIERISWSIDGRSQSISRSLEPISEDCTKVLLEGNKPEKWLLFSKKFEKEPKCSIRIAYKLRTDKNSAELIDPVPRAKIFNYFETDKDSNLKFLIDGPFHTNPLRDNIKEDEWNKDLIIEAAQLMSESLDRLKELNLLTVDLLNSLPIDIEFSGDPLIYPEFYDILKEKMKKSNLLPTKDGFITPSEAVISRSEDLRSLLGGQELKDLYGGDKKWLIGSITEDNFPLLKNYLMKELDVQEVTPASFAAIISKDYIERRSDEWIVRFYSFLRDQPALWDSKHYNPVLRNKPIIRLFNNTHVFPFGNNGQPAPHLPTDKLSKDLNLFFHVVKEEIVRVDTAKEFLIGLGIKEVDRETVIREYVLPKYSNEVSKVDETNNILHLQWMTKAINQGSPKENYDLINAIKNTPILLATNAKTEKKEYKPPTQVLLPKLFTGKDELDDFYSGNESAWFLDERYLKKTDLTQEFFLSIGCKSEIEVKYRQIDFNDNINIEDSWGSHKRGLDGFDPEASIFGLDYALQNKNKARSKIIWAKLAKHYKLIKGTVEWSKNKSYSDSTKKQEFSEMGKNLINNPWILSKEGSFAKPSGIEYTDIAEDLVSGIQESPLIADKLGVKNNSENRVLEKYPLIKELLSLPEDARAKVESQIKSILDNLRSNKRALPSIEETRRVFSESLKSDNLGDPDKEEKENWRSINQSEEEKIRENYGDRVQDRIENSIVEINPLITKRFNSKDFDPKTFLEQEYDGHCQICNTRLDLGKGKTSYFDIFRIIKESELPYVSESEFNVICLCPNCHALARHGGLDLQELQESIEKVGNHEKIAEAVGERGGNFYIFQVKLAGKPVEIYYTQRHYGEIFSILVKGGKYNL